MINTMSESLKERKKMLFFNILVRDEHKKFYNLGHGPVLISASWEDGQECKYLSRKCYGQEILYISLAINKTSFF